MTIIKRIKKIIFLRIINPAILLKKTIERIRLRKRLARLQAVPIINNRPVLCYAEVLKNLSNCIITGGAVKLLNLVKQYDENIDKSNILYLVSSHLPDNVGDWISWAKSRKIKIVINQNGVAYPAWAGSSTQVFNSELRYVIHSADFVIYQSEFCRISADHFLGPVNAEWHVLYNSVDTDHFIPSQEEIPTSPIRLLSLGSHHEAYRIISALETLRSLRQNRYNANLTIGGRILFDLNSPGGRKYHDLLRDPVINEYVYILNPYSQDEAPEIYKKAHVLLHPKYKDPCPTVPIEAMACGVPVVGSNSGGMTELIGSDSGILVDVPDSWEELFAPDSEAMARAVIEIIGKWNVFSNAARNRATKMFSNEQWIKQHEKIFDSLVQESKI